MKNNRKNVYGILLVALIVVAILAALSFVIMMLWNLILPDVILCDEINFWQSAGLIALISLLTFDKAKLFDWIYE